MSRLCGPFLPGDVVEHAYMTTVVVGGVIPGTEIYYISHFWGRNGWEQMYAHVWRSLDYYKLALETSEPVRSWREYRAKLEQWKSQAQSCIISHQQSEQGD